MTPIPRSGAPTPPEIFGTCQHGMTNSNHIFIVIKQDERKILLGGPHSCPGEKNSVTRQLTFLLAVNDKLKCTASVTRWHNARTEVSNNYYMRCGAGVPWRRQTQTAACLLISRHVNLLDYYRLLLSVWRARSAGPAAGWLVDGQDVAVIFPNDNLSCCDDDDCRQPNCFPQTSLVACRLQGRTNHQFVKRLSDPCD